MATPPMPEYCWPISWGCVSEESMASIPQEVRDYAEAMAVSTLRMLTLYQVGGCEVTVRPCAPRCGTGWSPTIDPSGNWVNMACGCGSNLPCGCGRAPVVELDTPVGRISEVTIDGAPLDPSAYLVLDGGLLVRTDGGEWPRCQDFTAGAGEEGSFAVTYLNAYPVDGLGSWAAGVLAYEYAKACMGGDCALPSGVTQISRQGISMEIQSDMFSDGLTGLRLVDDWTATFNPNRLRRKPMVFSPDAPSPTHARWVG